MAGDVQLCCHVDKVIAHKLRVSVQSFFYDTQGCSQVIALIVTPEGQRELDMLHVL